MPTPDRPVRSQPTLRGLDVDAHLADPARKQRFVTPMFEIIAPRYDAFTRVFSYGMDRRWKRELLRALGGRVPADGTVLDLACGTGDLAFGAAALVPRGRVIGIDLAPPMLEIAERRRGAGHSRVSFELGDMCDTELPDASVDAVTAGYALRNAPNYAMVLREIRRVLKPGGLLVSLDFYRPRSALWRSLFLSYLSAAGNCVGWMWHGEGVVYGYISRSIDHFVSYEGLSGALEVQGFAVERVRRKLMGGVALHVARKLPEAAPTLTR